MRRAAISLLALSAAACGGSSNSESTGTSLAIVPEPPPAPVITPQLPDASLADGDGDRIEDAILRRTEEVVEVEIVLRSPTTRADMARFVAAGGVIEHVFTHVSHGFTGKIPRRALPALARALGERLHLVSQPMPIVLHLDEATRTGRVRPVWASGFTGSASGFSGSSTTTIAILDTGVDDTHTDLAGRMQGWKDYTGGGLASAQDIHGHGTHVTGIATGTGAAFGATSGTGTLKFTGSGTLSGVSAGAQPFYVHSPTYLNGSATTFTASGTAIWNGGASTTFYIGVSNDGGSISAIAAGSGTSPLSISGSTSSSTANRIMPLLNASTTGGSVTEFSESVQVTNYPTPGDGFSPMRGVAPGCKWFGARVTDDSGTGNTIITSSALDDLVSRRATDNVKVINMSFGSSGTDTTIRAKVNTAVANGIVVVASAGNAGPSGTITDPGLAAKAITVGSSSDLNQLTSYTSVGISTTDSTQDTKPDLLAPGGSYTRSYIMAPDTNDTDAQKSGFGDQQANDYAPLLGTSMAAPFASGAAALVIQAIESTGTTWTFSGDTQPLLVKMLLLATATETNSTRDSAGTNDPTLGRATTPKDTNEGYGMLNVDAAIEAARTTFASPWTDTTSGTRTEWDRRAWARKISLVHGTVVKLSMTQAAAAEYDLYLFAGSSDGKGNPVIRASSTNTTAGTAESINFTSSATETAYIVVKRVSGSGSFTVTGTIDSSKCGNGVVDTGETCDPSASTASTCCASDCSSTNESGTCSDGNACTSGEKCTAGVCGGGTTKTCTASDQCHSAGTCDSTTGACSNPVKTGSCDDGNACTSGDTCVSGVCTGGAAKTCTASDQCHSAGTCDSTTGVCSNPVKTGSCDDGNACTSGDTCVSGVCTGTAKTCVASDQCHSAGTCDSTTGVCSNPTKTGSCDDGNPCTTGDTCTSGVCAGTAKTCVASDQCHSAGTCDSTTGVCSNPTKSGSCDDGNACTTSDSCVSGVCTGTAKTCTATDQCHSAGTCDPTSGACTNPVKTGSCNDGDACTTGDTCVSGVCTGTSKSCAASDQCHSAGTCDPISGTCSNPTKVGSCDDGDPCTTGDTCVSGVCKGTPKVCTASDQCHSAGTCDSATGTCSNPVKTGTCNDGNACTSGDTCVSGVCTGTAKTCAASDQCHSAGTCDPTTGACSNPIKTGSCDDGNACTSGDSCVSGVCKGGPPKTCAASDQCHAPGVCDPLSGACSNPPKIEGAPCSDGSACTIGDSCQGGVCIGGSTKTCPAPDQCHTVSSCDMTTGACTTMAKPDSTPCDDGNACTVGETCQAGVCSAGTAKPCAPTDQCHAAGTCDPATGFCSNPAKVEGAPCDDGDACTASDGCKSGACVGTAITCAAIDECHAAGSCSAGLCSTPARADGTPCSLGVCDAGTCTAVDAGADAADAVGDADDAETIEADVDADDAELDAEAATDSDLDADAAVDSDFDAVGETEADADAESDSADEGDVATDAAVDDALDASAGDALADDAADDAGVQPAIDEGGGCGCRTTARNGASPLGLLLLLAFLRRRNGSPT